MLRQLFNCRVHINFRLTIPNSLNKQCLLLLSLTRLISHPGWNRNSRRKKAIFLPQLVLPASYNYKWCLRSYPNKVPRTVLDQTMRSWDCNVHPYVINIPLSKHNKLFANNYSNFLTITALLLSGSRSYRKHWMRRYKICVIASLPDAVLIPTHCQQGVLHVQIIHKCQTITCSFVLITRVMDDAQKTNTVVSFFGQVFCTATVITG